MYFHIFEWLAPYSNFSFIVTYDNKYENRDS